MLPKTHDGARYTLLWSLGACVNPGSGAVPNWGSSTSMSPGCAVQEKAASVLSNLVPQSMDLVALMSPRRNCSSLGGKRQMYSRVCSQS